MLLIFLINQWALFVKPEIWFKKATYSMCFIPKICISKWAALKKKNPQNLYTDWSHQSLVRAFLKVNNLKYSFWKVASLMLVIFLVNQEALFVKFKTWFTNAMRPGQRGALHFLCAWELIGLKLEELNQTLSWLRWMYHISGFPFHNRPAPRFIK